MPIENYTIKVFCWIDDYLAIILDGKRLRARGPAAALCASEVITMEVVGEALGFHQAKQIWQYFSQH
ncbi:MAG: family transposase [Gammaproteobacteria bacterium]|jgi:hypothetical protein|nr:family transposase [Gammaproteobacteria bacterium]